MTTGMDHVIACVIPAWDQQHTTALHALMEQLVERVAIVSVSQVDIQLTLNSPVAELLNVRNTVRHAHGTLTSTDVIHA